MKINQISIFGKIFNRKGKTYGTKSIILLFHICFSWHSFGFLSDIFRAIRRSVKSSNLATNIEDIFFVIISFLIIVYSILQMVNQGELIFLYFLRNYYLNY